VPMTTTSTTNAIKSHKDPRRAGAVGAGAAASGVLAGSGDVLAVAPGVVAAAAGGLTGSGDVLAVAAGVAAAAAGVAGSFRGLAGGRVW
jgi:hypothetical protein